MGDALKPTDTLLLLLLALIWGSAFLMIGVAVDEVPPLTMVAGRLVIAGAMLVVIAVATGSAPPQRGVWPWLVVMAILNNAMPFTLITWAEQHIASNVAATLNATMSLFTFLIATSIGSERATRGRFLGVVTGFVGAAVVMAPDLGDIRDSDAVGSLAVILAAFGYGASAVLAREKLRGSPVVLAGGQMAIGALIMLPFAAVVDGAPDFGISAKAGLSWIGLGVFSSGLAYIIYFGLLQRSSATSVAIVSYLIPVAATMLGWLILDEHIGLNLFLGLALIIVGVMAVNGTIGSLIVRRRPAKVIDVGASGV